MKNFFAKLGDRCLGAFIHAAFFIWTGITHVLYLPKITYEDKSVKKLLKKPCILIANHTSHNDGSFIPQVFWRSRINVLVTTKWYDKKLLHVFFTHLRYIPINLKEMDNSWMDRAVEAIRRGESVLIFPEGKLSKEGKLSEFQPGFLMLARLTDAPVIPLAISGGYRKFHRQKVAVGSVNTFDVHAKGRPSAILREGAASCQRQLENMLHENNRPDEAPAE